MSQVKLNLGAGTFPLPFVRDSEPNAEHTLPLPDVCYEDGWINIDKFAREGIQEQINLFNFPWIRSSNGNPFNDNSVDCIWASHFLEHVPHEVKTSNKIPLGGEWRKYRDFVDSSDGFFVFFYEAWRVLKPNGLIYIRCPFGVCYDALCDPTHTRRVVPGSFSYLTDTNDTQPFDYNIPARFEMEGNITWRMARELVDQIRYYTSEGLQNMIRMGDARLVAFDITLRAVKE